MRSFKQFIALIPRFYFVMGWPCFQELNFKGLYLTHKRKRKSLSCRYRPPYEVKLGSFMSWTCNDGKEIVQKSVMHVKSCCFADLRACLHGGGGPQVGEVTRLGWATRLAINYLDGAQIE